MGDIKYGLAWSTDYELGCAEVDEQHHRLFILVSDLVQACMDELDAQALHETLGFMVNYAVQHFTDEEKFQLDNDYPDYERHKQIHEDFKVKVGELVQEFNDNGSSVELSNNVNKTIVRWLINHIQREDMKIGEHIRKQNAT